VSARRSTFARAAIAVVILSVTVSGCASTPDALKQATADQLQAGVLSVTTAASAGDFGSAQAALDSLQADLLAAAAAGDVTGSRSAEIQSAINLVGADLDAASAAAIEAAKPTPTPTPTPTKDSKPGKGDDDKKGGKGKDD
jgi:hypothetical protein